MNIKPKFSKDFKNVKTKAAVLFLVLFSIMIMSFFIPVETQAAEAADRINVKVEVEIPAEASGLSVASEKI
ncbi:MAG TPA: hypothetical protein DHN33_01225, partial [Eubacteriaceae bacterium]|nr:hypothetical protein [Eubacteriaceae bacterium]